MFVKITGFRDPEEAGNGLVLKEDLRHPTKKNHQHVILALVRWLSPHPNAITRDDKKLPVCPPPFEFNHALWTFSKVTSPRTCFTESQFQAQSHLFGETNPKAHHLYARYGLVQPTTFETFMNCTVINKQNYTILETITLPFP